MAAATLRRHLSVLVEAGLIVRRDSPNGKRYARKGRGGAIERAFGFDLSPLVARAGEFSGLAEAVREEEGALKRARERLTLARRAVVKLIAAAIAEGVPADAGVSAGAETGLSFADWGEAQAAYRALVSALPRSAPRALIEGLADELAGLAGAIGKRLEDHAKTRNSRANESQSERHKQSSKPETFPDLEPCLREGRGEGPGSPPEEPSPPRRSAPASATAGARPERAAAPRRPDSAAPERAGGRATYPLGMVLEACPDLIDYARAPIRDWRGFCASAALVRSLLGISPSAYEEAQDAMGEIPAAIAVACLLQRGERIASPGGYLRALTQKARDRTFSIGPMLVALLKTRAGPRAEPRRSA